MIEFDFQGSIIKDMTQNDKDTANQTQVTDDVNASVSDKTLSTSRTTTDTGDQPITGAKVPTQKANESVSTEPTKPTATDQSADQSSNAAKNDPGLNIPLESATKKRRWPAIMAGVLALMGLAGYGAYWEVNQRVFERPVASATPDAPVMVTIQEGDSARRVMERLRTAGLDADDLTMRLAAKLAPNKLSRIHTGTYRFEPGLTPAGILQTLAKGPLVDQQLRIPDGAPIWEVLAIFKNATALKQTTATMTPEALRAALEIDAPSLEGWFAPDTYHYMSGSTDLAVMKKAVAKQKALLDRAWAQRGNAELKTPYEALILASIIEKETGLATDRHQISSVFHNRLKLKMPLQTDPTVIYGIGEKFNGNLTRKDLQTATPYNTYKIPALPPTPIAMPSWASIEAAVNPADTKYLYFVSRGDGSSQFSTNLKAHNRAVRQYILSRPKTTTKTEGQ